MDSLISTFHLDIKLLIAQIINFAIVIAVLYFFALKPLVKVMQEREKRVEKSLSDAKKIEERLGQAEMEYKKTLTVAKQEAAQILVKTKEEADKKKAETVERAKEEIGQVINKERAKMLEEKRQTLKEIKSEVADLVALSLEKLLDKKFTGKDDQELIRKIVGKNK